MWKEIMSPDYVRFWHRAEDNNIKVYIQRREDLCYVITGTNGKKTIYKICREFLVAVQTAHEFMENQITNPMIWLNKKAEKVVV